MKKYFVLSALFTFFALSLVGQRPKVGLVLSGGGAKGFSHIGVLKVLEEAGIRPDYITGTSMGSVVGGLYAMGYPADSLEQLALGQDWTRVLTDALSLRDVIFEEKLFFKNQQLELPFQDGHIKTPSGLIQGHSIENLLGRLTLPASDTINFDDLPIPFRCVATDLYSGKPVVFSNGSLAEGIRASMAIPSAFTPVLKDTLILIDGGVIRNFPVGEAHDMGAEIIIGVHCGPRNAEREELEGLAGILPQALFLGSIQDTEKQMELVDIYIEPEMKPYGAADFASADSIIARGEVAARRHFSKLKTLADSLDALGPPPEIEPLAMPGTIRIDRIDVIGNERVTSSEIIGRSGIEPGAAVSPEALDQAIDNLFGTNYFVKIKYGMHEENGANVLTFYCIEKANALIKGSLTYDSYHNVGLAFNLTLRNLLGPSSRFMAVGKLADNYRYRFSYLKYLGEEKHWFIEGQAQFNRDELPAIQQGQVVQEFRLRERVFDLAFSRRFAKNTLLSLGAEWEDLSLKPTISETPIFQNLKLTNLNPFLRLQHNSLDRNVLPTSGIDLLFEFKYINNLRFSVEDQSPELPPLDSVFSTDGYPQLTLRAMGYLPTGAHSGLRIAPFAGLIWNSLTLLDNFYTVGAPELLSRRSIPFYGLDPNEFVAQVALGSSLGYQYFIWPNLMVALDVSAGFFSETSVGSKGLSSPDEFLAGAGLTIGYSNPLIGPIKLTMMHPIDTDGQVRNRFKFFLTIGHRF